MRIISPAATQVLLAKSKQELKTKSGLLLPEQKNATPPNVADVLSVGKEVKDYKAKDTVVFKQFTATPVEIDGEDYALIDHRDIMGKVVTKK